MPRSTLTDHRLTAQSFQDLLDEAWASVSTDWETSFVQDQITRWKKFSMGIYVSDSQLEQLRRIAGQGPQ